MEVINTPEITDHFPTLLELTQKDIRTVNRPVIRRFTWIWAARDHGQQQLFPSIFIDQVHLQLPSSFIVTPRNAKAAVPLIRPIDYLRWIHCGYVQIKKKTQKEAPLSNIIASKVGSVIALSSVSATMRNVYDSTVFQRLCNCRISVGEVAFHDSLWLK